MAYGERGDLTTPAKQERVGTDNEPVCPDFDQGCERRINVAFGACLDDVDLQSECAARCLRVLRGGLGNLRQPRLRGDHSPVALPPGRLRLATSPSATGLDAVEKMIGIVVVAALAASADGVPAAAITAT